MTPSDFVISTDHKDAHDAIFSSWCYFHPPTPKHPPHQPTLEHPQPMSSAQCERHSFTHL